MSDDILYITCYKYIHVHVHVIPDEWWHIVYYMLQVHTCTCTCNTWWVMTYCILHVTNTYMYMYMYKYIHVYMYMWHPMTYCTIHLTTLKSICTCIWVAGQEWRNSSKYPVVGSMFPHPCLIHTKYIFANQSLIYSLIIQYLYTTWRM